MKERKLRIIYLFADYLSTVSGVLVFSLMRFLLVEKIRLIYGCAGNFFASEGMRLTILLFPVFMMGVYYLSGYYVRVVYKSRAKEFISTLLSVGIGAMAFFMVVLLNDVLPGRIFNYELLLLLFVCLFVPVYLFRFLITTYFIVRSRSRNIKERLLLIGDANVFSEYRQLLCDSGKEMVGVVDIGDDGADVLTDVTLGKFIDDYNAHGFILAISKGNQDMFLKSLGEFFHLEKPVYVTPDDYRLLTSRVVYDNLMTAPLMDISRSSLSDSVVAVKRFVDVVGAVFGLVVSLPLLAVLALCIKLKSKGPVIYSQERIGFHRRPFRIYKLRSMTDNAESNGPALSSDNDPRITPIGHFMRKYRLDEIPNLWNVLRGDMSLVGPRPERKYYLDQIKKLVPYCSLLHQVRPGLTSLGMVKFGYASTIEEMVLRMRYDLIYIQNLSLSLDLKIMFYTLRTVFNGEGK